MGWLRAFGLLLMLRFLAEAETDWSLVWFPTDDAFHSWANAGIWTGLEFTPTFPRETHRWEVALCSMGNPGKTQRISFPEPDERNESWLGWRNSIVTGEAAQELDRLLGEGTFLGAILADGKRCSNVVRLSIRHDYDPAREPVIRLVPIQPPQGSLFTYIGIIVVPPPAAEVVLTDFAVGRPDLEVDGHWMEGWTQAWSGVIAPVPAGVPCGYPCFLRPYTYPKEGASGGAMVRARIRAHFRGEPVYLSAPVTLALDPSDADRFDRALGLK